jgi:hypothetical protein
MDQNERTSLANERADRYAPKPTGGSLMAGVCGTVVAVLGDLTISAFYGWRTLDHLLILALVSVSGFLVGFLGYKRLARTSRKARREELTRVEHEEGERHRSDLQL